MVDWGVFRVGILDAFWWDLDGGKGRGAWVNSMVVQSHLFMRSSKGKVMDDVDSLVGGASNGVSGGA